MDNESAAWAIRWMGITFCVAGVLMVVVAVAGMIITTR